MTLVFSGHFVCGCAPAMGHRWLCQFRGFLHFGAAHRVVLLTTAYLRPGLIEYLSIELFGNGLVVYACKVAGGVVLCQRYVGREGLRRVDYWAVHLSNESCRVKYESCQGQESVFSPVVFNGQSSVSATTNISIYTYIYIYLLSGFCTSPKHLSLSIRIRS